LDLLCEVHCLSNHINKEHIGLKQWSPSQSQEVLLV
jgi:hypothetical protein